LETGEKNKNNRYGKYPAAIVPKLIHEKKSRIYFQYKTKVNRFGKCYNADDGIRKLKSYIP